MKTQPPVFCDDCSMLAVAVLDAAPLCIGCLTDHLEGTTLSKTFELIAPLEPGIGSDSSGGTMHRSRVA